MCRSRVSFCPGCSSTSSPALDLTRSLLTHWTRTSLVTTTQRLRADSPLTNSLQDFQNPEDTAEGHVSLLCLGCSRSLEVIDHCLEPLGSTFPGAPGLSLAGIFLDCSNSFCFRPSKASNGTQMVLQPSSHLALISSAEVRDLHDSWMWTLNVRHLLYLLTWFIIFISCRHG